jgi:hypothetical protein
METILNLEFLSLQLFPSTGDASLVGILIFVFPLSFCYYFLYYTDTLSTLSLLLCYWLTEATRNYKKTATRLGSFFAQLLLLASASVAIMARQTNAVWVMFIAGTSMLSFLQEKGHFRYVGTEELKHLLLLCFQPVFLAL